MLHYDDYHENENLFFILEEKEPYTIGSLKRYIKEYFSMIYKMNLKINLQIVVPKIKLILSKELNNRMVRNSSFSPQKN